MCGIVKTSCDALEGHGGLSLAPVFFFVVIFLSHSLNIVFTSTSDSPPMIQRKGGKPVISFHFADAPIWQSRGQKCSRLRSVMTQVVPVLPPDGGAAVKGLGVAAQNHPVLPETPEELVSQRAAQAEERLGHPTNQRARELQRTVPAHARQGEWQFM